MLSGLSIFSWMRRTTRPAGSPRLESRVTATRGRRGSAAERTAARSREAGSSQTGGLAGDAGGPVPLSPAGSRFCPWCSCPHRQNSRCSHGTPLPPHRLISAPAGTLLLPGSSCHPPHPVPPRPATGASPGVAKSSRAHASGSDKPGSAGASGVSLFLSRSTSATAAPRALGRRPPAAAGLSCWFCTRNLCESGDCCPHSCSGTPAHAAGRVSNHYSVNYFIIKRVLIPLPLPPEGFSANLTPSLEFEHILSPAPLLSEA